jgi:hypothetical protein
MMISEADKAIWDELDDMSRHMLDPTIPWEPKTRAEAGMAELIRRGELVDSLQRRRSQRTGKLLIVWVTDVVARARQ